MPVRDSYGKPATFEDNPEQFYAGQATNHPHAEVGQLQLALMRAAFSCDMARVGTFMWAPGTSHVVFGGLFPGMMVSSHHPPSHETDETVDNWLTEIDKWYAEQTSLALQQFANTPGGNRFLKVGPKRPMNDVWLAMSGVFGVNLPSLGAPEQHTGPLPGLFS